mgnify:CR=1 FL=1
MTVKPYCLGADNWPGLSKLIEECGEVVQIGGKILGNEGREDHWDGTNLRTRLEDEMADVLAAITFMLDYGPYEIDSERVVQRSQEKLQRFVEWDRDTRRRAEHV